MPHLRRLQDFSHWPLTAGIFLRLIASLSLRHQNFVRLRRGKPLVPIFRSSSDLLPIIASQNISH